MKKLVNMYVILCLVVVALFCSGKIGFAKDQEGERTKVLVHSVPGEPELERMVLIFRKGKGEKGKKPGGAESDPSYKLIVGGLRWENLPVSYGIDSPGYFSQVVSAFEEWDSWTSKELFDDYPDSISGGGLQRDGSNTVSWQSLSSLFGSDVVAITQLIYNTRRKIMIEFDMAFNSDLPWSNGSADAFDARNVATHEAGHVVSLDDLYKKGAAELTMYGYTTEGETKKQTLAEGDKLGLWKVYGN